MAYRLIHNDTDALALIEAIGTTRTKHTVFTGTLDECSDEITRLNLTTTDEIDTMLQSTQTLSAAKAAKIAQIASDRYAVQIAGVEYTEDGATYRLKTGINDILLLDSYLEKLRRGIMTSVRWKCHDDVWVTIDLNNMNTIEALVLTHVQTAYAAEEAAQEAIASLTTVEEVNNYTFSL